MKFTKEEIALCKKIAEKHRKELCYGDWWKGKGDDIFLMNVPDETLYPKEQHKELIPLWQISDCLEFLETKEFHVVKIEAFLEGGRKIAGIRILKIEKNRKAFVKSGETILEACLKAVLAIVKKEE